jgi:hypothetical protein
MKDKSARHRHDTLAEDRAMVSAIFGAVANFANSPEEKLKAIIRAGKIAKAFLSGAGDGTSPAARDTKVFRKKNPRLKVGCQTGQRRTADSDTDARSSQTQTRCHRSQSWARSGSR